MLSNLDAEIVFRKNKAAKRFIIKIISQNKVEVIIPKGGTKSFAFDFLSSQKNLVENKLNELRKFVRNEDEERRYKYLGKNLTFEELVETLKVENKTVKLNNITNKEIFYDKVLRNKSEEYLIQKIQDWSNQLNLYPKSVKIKKLKRSWGLCSKRGDISLNYKLIKLGPNLIDYVLVHELIHLLEFNHSKNFYDKLKKILPDYKFRQEELKNELLF